jgi:HAD superfamily phosphatase (TIGR01668 family)
MGVIRPDAYFSRIADIDIEHDLKSQGLRTVLLDIDNTLRSRADGGVPADARAWLARCKRAGVGVCLLSNNWHGNVFDLADELDLPIVAKALKPLPTGYLVALRDMHAKARTTVVVGDQLFTDIVGAKMLGIRAYMVAPLAEVDLPYTAALRNIERAIVGEG